MIPVPKDMTALISALTHSELYEKLLQQIKKDFELCGHPIELKNNILPQDLIHKLTTHLHQLIQQNFGAYLQLLYRIDIPETSMYNNEPQNTQEIARKATFAILQREWQKINLKNKF